MKWIYGLVLGLILVGCQSAAPDNNYNQYLDAKIEELYQNRLDNYIIVRVSYDQKYDSTKVSIIDLERNQLNYLEFEPGYVDTSRIKPLTHEQVTNLLDCNRNFTELNISPQTAIELAIKDDPTIQGKDFTVSYIPEAFSSCSNQWMVTTHGYIALINAATGDLQKPKDW